MVVKGSLGEPLTERETAILQLKSEGKTDFEVSQQLGTREKPLSVTVIGEDLQAINIKFDVSNITAAVAIGLRRGLITGPQVDPIQTELLSHELRALQEAANGTRTAGIATEQEYSERTVKSHFTNTYRKLGAKNRPHAVAIALKLNLIQ